MSSSTLMSASPTNLDLNSSSNNNNSTINLNNQPTDVIRNVVSRRTVDDVWKEIVSESDIKVRKVCKIEVPDDMMTLEDFLVRAGAVDKEEVMDEDVKLEMRVPLSGSVSAGVGMISGGSRMFSFDSGQLSDYMSGGGSVYGSGMLLGLGSNVGGGKDGGGSVVSRVKRRGSGVFENVDKAVQKRQKRMIKNRESAARSRERKQEHQVQLEALASKLEEENEQLVKAKAALTKERLKLLMEKIIPVIEQRKPPRPLRRVNSWEW